jgi:predicted ATPase/class 3 adenylate cyclase
VVTIAIVYPRCDNDASLNTPQGLWFVGMTSLATGTVCFLMTDIEGSTRLVATFGDAFPRLLDEHFSVLDEAVTGNGGTVVSSEGDSLFAVFAAARQAIAAAISGQRAIAAHQWPSGVELKVRMGIHAGEAVIGGRDYTGIDVHRTARIAAAAWGGEVIASDAARSLAGDVLPDGASFRDLGIHGLRDLPAPERLFQLCAPGLIADFPPPRTLTIATPSNLPSPITRFIGRARELQAVQALLENERLVTLTGPGGTGKTRLAIEAARGLLERYPDGVWFVALDTVRDASLLIPTIAQTLHVPEQPGRPIATTLADSLASKRTLLVLDNLEQIVAGAPDVATLLAATTTVAVLGSSREPLAIGGEHVYAVPPLGLPAEPGRPKAADLAGSESVDLFVERARATRSDFSLDDENAPAVAAICRRLDGLPLAIELAAARINVLAPEQILSRLDHRLTLLASSHRDLPERQRTLRGAIDWSHELLAEPERAFFRRFSVFAGGADVDAVSAVIDPDGSLGTDPLDLASGLVDRSLLRSTRDGSGSRLEMLETIREYAAERLTESTEALGVRERHAAYYRALAEPMEFLMLDPQRDELLERLERELPNIRAAIAWSLEAADYGTGLVIMTALHDYWHMRDHIGEARRALDDLSEASAADGATPLRAKATQVAAELASWIGDYGPGLELAERAVALAEAAGDRRTLMAAHMAAGWTTIQPQTEKSVAHFNAAIALAREMGDERTLAVSLGGQSVALIRLHDLDQAAARATETLEITRRIGDRYNAVNAHASLAMIAMLRGDLDGAARGFAEVVRGSSAAGGHLMMLVGLDGLAAVALERGDLQKGARLAAAADELRVSIGGGATLDLVGLEPALDRARRTMDPVEFERAAGEGRALTMEQVVAQALGETPVSER